MKTFTYAITDAAGIHARPAGLLVKEAKKFESKISVAKGAQKTVCRHGPGCKTGRSDHRRCGRRG